MMRLSRQYVAPLSGCLLVALVPVVVHSYLRVEKSDCRNPEALLSVSSPASDAARKRDSWMRERFESAQWHEESFVRDGLRFDVTMIRSYDAKRLYHRPENSLVARSLLVEKRGIEWAPAASGPLPIHRAYYSNPESDVLVGYLLVYRSSPVASPYVAQMQAAPVELFAGRYPMTLFFIQGRGSPGSLGKMESIARDWLVSAWAKYRSTCMD
jgi:hypothetical protein